MVDPNLAEVKNHETIPEEVIFRYLDGVGNHEVKNLLAGLILSEPEREFTNRVAQSEMNDRQGSKPEWALGPTRPQEYFTHSMEPIGAVVRGQTIGPSGKLVDAWRASDEHPDVKLALSGFISDWSLRWPNVSVQRLFGATNSRGGVRSPQVRTEMYQAMLATDQAVDYETLWNAMGQGIYKHYTALHVQVKRMADAGILTASSKRSNYNPLLNITNVEIPKSGRTASIPESRAFYSALSQLEVGSSIRAYELVDKAKAIDESIDAQKLRNLLIHSINTKNSRAYPGVQLAQPEGNKGMLAVIEFADGMREPVAELIAGISRIQQGFDIDIYSQRAREILGNPEEFRVLIAKAREFSANHVAQRDRVEADERLTSVVSRLGAASLIDVRKAMREEYGQETGRDGVARRLRDLVKSGQLIADEVSAPHMKRKRLKYSVNADVSQESQE